MDIRLFPPLATVNKHVCRSVYLSACVLKSLGFILVELLSHLIILCLFNFLRSCQTVFYGG